MQITKTCMLTVFNFMLWVVFNSMGLLNLTSPYL